MFPKDGCCDNTTIQKNEMNVYLLHVFMFASIRYKRLFLFVLSIVYLYYQ